MNDPRRKDPTSRRLCSAAGSALLALAVSKALLTGARPVSAIELAAVAAGRGGFVVEGKGRYASGIGWSVAGAGDVNGDGIPDTVLGGVAVTMLLESTGTYVVFGREEGGPIDLEEVTSGQGGFFIDAGGTSVSGAGDVNGDGLADLITGDPYASPGGRFDAGESYVIFGKATTGAVGRDDLDAGLGGFVIRGASEDEYSGELVAGTGDVNGDGLSDLLVFAFSSHSYVVFGKADGTPVELADIAAGRGGFVIDGGGWRASGAGDVNGDGLDDILVGNPEAAPDGKQRAGTSYVVLGKTTTGAVELADIARGEGGFVVRGKSEGDAAGRTVAGAGDVNGDGLDDLLVGTASGIDLTYVVFGKPDRDPVETSRIAAGEGGFAIRGTARSLAGAGDINGDGLADLLLGDPYSSPEGRWQAGETHVVFGKRSTEEIALSDVALGQGGFVIRGESAEDRHSWNAADRSGFSVAGVGDVNGDGLAEILVGAPWEEPGWVSPGACYLVFGKADGEAMELSEVVDGAGGQVIRGFGRISFGSRVTSPGDVNGDGLDDLFVGVSGVDLARDPENRSRFEACTSHVVFGRSAGEPIALSDVASGQGGFAIQGENPGDEGKWNISAAGDVNGDGLDDLLIGLPREDPEAWTPSAVFVVFGKATTEEVVLANVATGKGGFMIRGGGWISLAGSNVAGAGDVNGDGLDDLLIGIPGADPGAREGAGESYVVFGKTTTDTVFLIDVATGQGGFLMGGENVGDRAGSDVAGAGDVNGDGLDDLLIAAPLADPGGRENAGVSYLVFGKPTTEAVLLADVATGQGGFVMRGESAADRAGSDVAGAGDVNGDGLDDLLIAAPAADPGGRENAGMSYLVFGKATGEAVELSDLTTGQGGFVLRGESAYDRAGSSVSGAGDVNGDGLADVLIGAPDANPDGKENAGVSYLVFGKATGDPIELVNLVTGQGGFVLRGESAWDRAGSSVSGGGDVNGDGVPDLAVSGQRFLAGRVHVVFGPPRGNIPRFRRGDDNGDGTLDITDPIVNLEYQFLGKGDPGCLAALDTNADTVLDSTDPIYNLEHQFLGRAEPPPPYRLCGPESLPADRALPCETPPASCK